MTRFPLLLAVALSACAASGAVFTVNNVNDSGAGSLRQAILDANANRDPDEIHFASRGSIKVSRALPIITGPVILDGTTAPFWFFAPIVTLDGQWSVNSGNGLTIYASNCVIKGLSIQRFPGSGILIIGGESNIIQRCWIGIDTTGWAYNGPGIQIFDANYNLIGGETLFARNWISGNFGENVWLRGRSSGNRIEGNVIGPDLSGAQPAPFGGHGVVIDLVASNNLVIGNIISGHPGVGVLISGGGTVVQRNLIGLTSFSSGPLGNGTGCSVVGPGPGTLIGGAGGGNVIAFNSGPGVSVAAGATNAAILSNSIHNNGGLGIDLGSSGPSVNDPADNDMGANQQQNYPILLLASGDGTVTAVLTSAPDANFQIEFFRNTACDPSGFGEGETLVGVLAVTTESDGAARFTTTLALPPTEAFATAGVTATATDATGNTSEFSPCVSIANAAPRFTKGSDITVDEDSGFQHFYGWATDISPGGSGEAFQTISFVVTNDNPALFDAPQSLNELGTLSFRPAPEANGSTVVTVVLRDNGGTAYGGADTSESQQFLITIVPVNDPPTAQPLAFMLDEDHSLVVQLIGSDVDGDPLTYVVTPPEHGTLSGTAPLLTYIPAPNYSGPDSFSYKVRDAQMESASATVSLTVLPVNDPPLAVARIFARRWISNEVGVVVIAGHKRRATLIFDGQDSSDIDSEILEYSWFDAEMTTPFATGARVTNALPVGNHVITLRVSDRVAFGTDMLLLKIVTASDVIANLIEQVNDSRLPRHRKQSLIAGLKDAKHQLDQGNWKAALRSLRRFQDTVQRQVVDPSVAQALLTAAGEIIRALEETSEFTELPRVGMPALSITRTSGRAAISWPVTAHGFVLEHASALTSESATWIRLAAPCQTNGTHFFIVESAPTSNTFYRLRRP